MNRFVKLLIDCLPSQPVYAHCDIPCGIYDPHQMQLAAHTVIRMVKLLEDLETPGPGSTGQGVLSYQNSSARMVIVKEDHAKKVEHELVTLWADYFKEEHLKDYPDLHDLIWKTIKLTGKVRQEVNMEAAKELLESVQKVAEIFYKTKGKEPVRVASIYPTEGEIVIYK